MPPVDPNDVLITGENSFIRLSKDGGATQSSRLSHWRVLWCPAGAGHVLFMQSELTGGQARVYSDNAAVARWLQQTIETYLFPGFAETALPVTSASFSRSGGAHSTVMETIASRDETIAMTWYDFMSPFVLTVPPGQPPERPIGVFSTFFPARRAQIELNGRVAEGAPWEEMRGDRQSSSASLAQAATGVRASNAVCYNLLRLDPLAHLRRTTWLLTLLSVSPLPGRTASIRSRGGDVIPPTTLCRGPCGARRCTARTRMRAS